MAAATMYVTPAGAGAKTGATWAAAMGEAEFEADLEAGAEAGDIYYVAGGNYTLDSAYDASARDGTAIGPISIIGVKTGTSAEPPVWADWADGNMAGGADERPIFICAANAVAFGDYYKLFNISFTTTVSSNVGSGTGNVLFNCKSTQQSPTANRYAFNLGNDTSAIFCEACGLVGTGVVGQLFRMGTSTCVFCWAHDGQTGFYLNAVRARVLFCVMEDLSVTGINCVAASGFTILNNTIHDCVVGITGNAATLTIIVNNLLEGCTTDGIIFSTQTDGNFFWKNHGDDARNNDMWDGVAVTMPHMDAAVSTGDPLFDGDGNLSLGAGSPCINNAVTPILGT